MKKIEMISVEKIYPHPNNPRRELGDLSELSESIKVNGVFQNLTVVPKDEDTYTVIIGHRRLAASKMAGLETVPCVITEMDEKTQVGTMLLENMQRSDLTLLEQAEGFQLMLDFGDSVEAVAEKTGFSESTVRRRVKLLTFDREKLKESMERQVTLDDYIKLDKLESDETKNQLLDYIGTANFDWKLKNAIKEEKDEKIKSSIEERLAGFAEKCDTTNNLRYITCICDDKFAIPEVAEQRRYFYRYSYGTYFYLYAEEKEAEKQVAKEEAKRIDPEEEKRKERVNTLEGLAKTAYEKRFEFIKNFKDHKKKSADIIRFAIAVCASCDELCLEFNKEQFSNLAGYVVTSANLVSRDYSLERLKIAQEKGLLCAAYSALGDWECDYHNYDGDYYENEELDVIYNLLSFLGYELSDEEREWKEGIHKAYRNKKEEE